MFTIHSVNSDRELVFSSYDGDHFQVELKGSEVSALTGVWEYSEEHGLNHLFQELARFDKPWQGAKSWEALEGEFSLSATCTTLGKVIFEVKLCNRMGSPEAWQMQAGIVTELGQLENIARKANRFFQIKSTE